MPGKNLAVEELGSPRATEGFSYRRADVKYLVDEVGDVFVLDDDQQFV